MRIIMVDRKDGEAALILRAVLALGRRLRAERPAGAAGLSAISILGTLERHGPMPAHRLAGIERLQPQSLTRILADLERRGWIRRTRSEADRREIAIAPTAAGRAVLVEDMQARRRWLEKTAGAVLTEAERAALVAAAAAMLKLAGSEPGGRR
jgi:DNA-binding MarR family transcriptional regulator